MRCSYTWRLQLHHEIGSSLQKIDLKKKVVLGGSGRMPNGHWDRVMGGARHSQCLSRPKCIPGLSPMI